MLDCSCSATVRCGLESRPCGHASTQTATLGKTPNNPHSSFFMGAVISNRFWYFSVVVLKLVSNGVVRISFLPRV